MRTEAEILAAEADVNHMLEGVRLAAARGVADPAETKDNVLVLTSALSVLEWLRGGGGYGETFARMLDRARSVRVRAGVL